MAFSSDSEFDDDNFMDDDSEFDDGSGEESESDYEEFETKAKKSKKKSPAPKKKKAPAPKPKPKAAAPKKKTLRKRGAPAATAAPKAPLSSPVTSSITSSLRSTFERSDVPSSMYDVDVIQETPEEAKENRRHDGVFIIDENADNDVMIIDAPQPIRLTRTPHGFVHATSSTVGAAAAAPGNRDSGLDAASTRKPLAPVQPMSSSSSNNNSSARSRKRKLPPASSSSTSSAATTAASSSSKPRASSSSSSRSSKPPPRKKPKGKIPEAEAQKILTDYMVKQNRPYNSLSVFENLHGAVPKTQTVKTMDALAESGVLIRKMFKKVKIYHPPQEQYGDIDDAELTKIEEETKSAQSELSRVSTDNHSLASECSTLEALPTNAEADAKIAALEGEMRAKSAELERLTGGAKLISDDDFKVAREKFEHAHNSWRKRRSIATRMVEAFLGTETDKTPKQLFKELECEMDEDCDVSLKEYTEFRNTMQGGSGNGRTAAGRRVSMHRR